MIYPKENIKKHYESRDIYLTEMSYAKALADIPFEFKTDWESKIRINYIIDDFIKHQKSTGVESFRYMIDVELDKYPKVKQEYEKLSPQYKDLLNKRIKEIDTILKAGL